MARELLLFCSYNFAHDARKFVGDEQRERQLYRRNCRKGFSGGHNRQFNANNCQGQAFALFILMKGCYYIQVALLAFQDGRKTDLQEESEEADRKD